MIITSYSVVQVTALAIFGLLMSSVIIFGKGRLRKPFISFLIAAAIFSSVSFMANQPFDYAVIWGRWVAFTGIATTMAYTYFVSVYTGKKRTAHIITLLGCLSLGFIGTLTIMGHIPEHFDVLDNGILVKDYGAMMLPLNIIGLSPLIAAMVLLIKHYRALKHPEGRNRTAYLITGIATFFFFALLLNIVPQRQYAIDHIGHLVNAVFITFVVVKHNLVDLKIVVRRGIVYSGITALVILSFMVLFGTFNYILNVPISATAELVILLLVIIVLASIFNPIRVYLERVADRLIYGSRYDYRQMVLNFATRMSNVIEMRELAEAMLRPITNAVGARQVSLLFATNGHFTSQFAERHEMREPIIPISLRRDGPVVGYLSRECKSLTRETINNKPEFKGMWQEDINSLEAAQVEILIPIKCKQELNAILALSKKRNNNYYSNDDVDMLVTMAHEAAVVIENARLYENAKRRANTDELTNLFNHRYFHQRLDEEIARCSRFGSIFSLIFMDMDLFKHYNDIKGHLAGDVILKEFGQIIKKTVRNIDVCFRYGGDEFAIILPETPLEGASKVAERIRKTLESKTDLKGILQTCSIGLASWPTDGVMREEIIRSADVALYHAKKSGGNRVCWACEVAISDVLRGEATDEPQNKGSIISTIYALAATVDAKDHHTYGHSKKVSKYATDIAEAMGYSKEQIEQIRTSALLHDIGKIGISDNLLIKQGLLTEDDWELIHAHPSLGVSILKHVDDLKDCLAAVQYHHERYDGTGYPAGLKGENIPLDARILAVADSFDAMTSERPYRSFKATREQAMEEVIRCAGTQFDPVVVDAFVSLQKRPSKTGARKRVTPAKS